jgi:hypothetical protein
MGSNLMRSRKPGFFFPYILTASPSLCSLSHPEHICLNLRKLAFLWPLPMRFKELETLIETNFWYSRPRETSWLSRWVQWCLGTKPPQNYSLVALPLHLQRLIVESLHLRTLAQMACLNTDLRTLYLERVNKRDTVVAGLLESQFTANLRQGLTPGTTALPRDLIVNPPVRQPCFWH